MITYEINHTTDGKILSASFDLNKINWQDNFHKKDKIWKPHTIYDSQRSKVYRAEGVLNHGSSFSTFKDTCDYIKYVLNHKWLHNNFRMSHTLLIRTGRMARRASASRGWWCGSAITLPKWARQDWVILHELAHLLTRFDYESPHGREFCAIYLQLVRHYLGKDKEKLLKNSFRKHKVKFSPYSRASNHAKKILNIN